MTDRIAVFRALYLGDMLLAVPALRALRRQFPDAEITLIGLPWAAAFRERYSRYLDRFVAFTGYPGLPEVAVEPQRVQAFMAAQRDYQYDLVVQMHGDGLISNAFVRELRGRVAAGYFPTRRSSAGAGLTIGAPYPENRHEIFRNLGLAALLGCTQLDPCLGFPLLESDFLESRRLLAAIPRAEGPRIGLHVGAKHPARRWPPAYFATLADALVRGVGAQIIFTGGDDEKPIVQEVSNSMQSGSIDLTGQTSLGGLAALLSALDLFISNDTGPAHLAYALDVPSITLFGPTDYRRWRPLERRRHLCVRSPVVCSPCKHAVCPIDHRCLTGIQPSLVQRLAIHGLQDSRGLHEEQKQSLLWRRMTRPIKDVQREC